MTATTAATSNTDPYLWVGSATGAWNDPSNWQDQTTGTAGVPNGYNAVQFGVDTPEQQSAANVTVTGHGGAASIWVYGNLTLAGSFRTDALNLLLFYESAPYYDFFSSTLTVTGAGNTLWARTATANGSLSVTAGATVMVARDYEIASGNPSGGDSPHYQRDGITVDGAGSKVTVRGLLSTDNASVLAATNGGYLEASRMTLDNSYGIAAYYVDAQSTIEVGSLGNAAAGTWTVDAGRTLVAEKSVVLNAPEFVVNGWMDDFGGLSLQGDQTDSAGTVTGTGRIRIEAGAQLSLNQSGDQLSIVFKGDNAQLNLLSGTTEFASRILGFAAGDAISVSGPTFDSATWQQGVLSLFEGTTLVGTVKMAGQYAGDTFAVANNVITLSAAASSSSPRSLQLFQQAVASFERHGAAAHELSAAAVPHGDRTWLAAAR